MKTNKKSIITLFIAALVFLFAVVCFSPAFNSKAYNGSTRVLENGWTRVMEDGSVLPFFDFGKTIDSRKIVLERDLTDFYHGEDAIGFYNYYSAVNVYLDDELVYQYGKIEDIENNVQLGNFYSMLCTHIGSGLGKRLRLEYLSNGPQTVYSIDVGSGAALEMAMIREYVPTVIPLILSIIFLLLVLILRKRKLSKNIITISHIWLSIFFLLVSVWELADSQLLMDIGFNAGSVCLLSFESYMLMPIPLLMFMYASSNKMHKLGSIMSYIALFNFLVLNVLHFAGIISFINSLLPTHICNAISIIIVEIQACMDYMDKHDRKSGILVISMTTFLISAVVQLLKFFVSSAGSNSQILFIGTVVFILMQSADLVIEVNDKLGDVFKRLEDSNEFLKRTFGKFIPKKIAESLANNTTEMGLGGDVRVITVLESDIRGFSELILNMTPNDVITMLNHYLEVMTEVIARHGGVIMEFVGDGIMASFDSSTLEKRHADRAIFAAIEMQNCLIDINKWNEKHGYPKMEMGIGLNTGNAFIGYIGSRFRVKYDIIGSTVNMASRIETYSTGGQVLISEATKNASAIELIIRNEYTVLPKGAVEEINLYDVAGIGEPYNLMCEFTYILPKHIDEAIEIKFVIVEGKHIDVKNRDGKIVALAETSAILTTDIDLRIFDNIWISSPVSVSCKVVSKTDEGYLIRFTSIPERSDAHGE